MNEFHKLYVMLVTILQFSSETKSFYFILLHLEMLMSKLANEALNLGMNIAGDIMLLGTSHRLFY